MVHHIEHHLAASFHREHGVGKGVASVEKQNAFTGLATDLVYDRGNPRGASKGFAGEFAFPTSPRLDVSVQIVGQKNVHETSPGQARVIVLAPSPEGTVPRQ